MFFLKKILAPLLFPLPVCLTIIAIGLVSLWFTSRKKLGRNLVTIGTLLLILASYEPLSDVFVSRLESKYQPLLVNPTSDSILRADPSIKWIAVLGEGHTSDPELPATSQLSMTALDRLIEGIRIHREISGSRLILSGGRGFDPVPQADIMANVAHGLGLADDEIVLERTSKDTEEEARIIHSIVGDDRFILVSSAYHMPRSMALFRKAGMNPIPAPANQLAKTRLGLSPEYFYPSAGGLVKLDIVLHEYFGLAWSRLRGTI